MNRSRILVPVTIASALVVAACSSGDTDEPLTVFAAASLTEVFEEAAAEFEADNPGLEVVLSFAGSSALASQIVEGAPADVFASANEPQMDVVVQAGLADGDPQVFTSNVLTIAVPTGNPAGIADFADLASPEVTLVVCAEQVPCGSATITLADALGVTLSPVSEELAVTDVLAKVAAGEADAGLVYVTDTIRNDAVESVPITGTEAAINLYPIVTLADAHPLADDFVAYIMSDEVQQRLTDAGFGEE